MNREEVYKSVQGRELLLHIFEADDGQNTSRPAIVFFNGGGFRVGTPAQFYPQSEYLATRGMVAIPAEYRVKEIHGYTSPVDCLTDGKSAIRWVRAHAQELGVDPNRIAAGGGSAGAFISAVAGMIQGFDDENEDQTVSSTPDAMVLFNIGFDAVNNEALNNIFQDDAQAVSPAFHIRPGLPPTIIFHGSADAHFPIAKVRAFCDKMQKARNICEFLPFEGMEHGFFNFGLHGNRPFTETLRAVDRFFISLGWLSGEPTI
jgi:acetyl esterase/lipase